MLCKNENQIQGLRSTSKKTTRLFLRKISWK